MQSLLVVVGRESESQASLRKAMVVARHLGACVDLLLCESEPSSPASEAGATRILEALRGSIAADAVLIETSWAGGVSLRAGIARRLGVRRSSLVVRSICGSADAGSRRASLAERELVSGGFHAPLWLSRRPAWAPSPRFGLAPDLGARGCPAWSDSARQLARVLARGSPAEVELLQGSPPAAIDALLLPAPGPGDGAAAARAQGLVDEVDCDLVFVPTAGMSGAVAESFSPRRLDAPALWS